jgi:hypothetical protein
MILDDSPFPPRPRECARCGGDLKLKFSGTYSNGSDWESGFKEKYQCRSDENHVGFVAVDAANPKTWDYKGVVTR